MIVFYMQTGQVFYGEDIVNYECTMDHLKKAEKELDDAFARVRKTNHS